MAFYFVASGTRVQSAGATTLTPTLVTQAARPAQLKLAVCQVKNNATITTATPGWTKLDQRDSGAGFTAAIFIGTATAANPVFTWTGSAACAARQWYYSNGTDVPETAIIGATTFATGVANPHTSASFASTRLNSMAVYIDAAAANTALNTPSGWTEGFDAGSVIDAGFTTSGSKRLTTIGSASGAISVTGAAAAWVQWQIELIITNAPAGLTDAETQIVPWVASGMGLGIAETQIVPWVASGMGLGIAETQVVLWLDLKPGRRRDLFIN